MINKIKFFLSLYETKYVVQLGYYSKLPNHHLIKIVKDWALIPASENGYDILNSVPFKIQFKKDGFFWYDSK